MEQSQESTAGTPIDTWRGLKNQPLLFGPHLENVFKLPRPIQLVP